ncbi:ABC transporter permease subunit [Paenibacillus sp. LMG 31460]|uniref:ABC transporter permease subunit n=1 Tax=Paenibacillus germinis TaxID=2654979 RepID=A0ABX1Z5U6_9BACL|nr:ABC transporter permease subunit [Paenibacillus germinis]
MYPSYKWVGLQNYMDLLKDNDFGHTIIVTCIIAFIVTIASNVLGLLSAMLVNVQSWIYNASRTIFFTPQVLSPVIVGFIWSIILTDDGVLNKVLDIFGLGGTSWLSNTDVVIYSICAVIIWQSMGFCTVVFLASLQSIPSDLYEAAKIDGCNRLQKFQHITFPLLAPGITINTVMLLISSFKVFDHVVVLTNGGPGTTTETISLKIINMGFVENQMGYASSMAVILFLLISVISVLVVTTLKRREVEY